MSIKENDSWGQTNRPQQNLLLKKITFLIKSTSEVAFDYKNRILMKREGGKGRLVCPCLSFLVNKI
jgi:hypothetical protein